MGNQIVVFGATGHTGGLVIGALLRALRGFDRRSQRRSRVARATPRPCARDRCRRPGVRLRLLMLPAPAWRDGRLVNATTASRVRRLPVRDARTNAFLVSGTEVGPDATERARTLSHVVAVARDTDGRALAEVHLEGPSPYSLTGELVTWAAHRLVAGRAQAAGVLGPVGAFGLDDLMTGCAQAGLVQVRATGGPPHSSQRCPSPQNLEPSNPVHHRHTKEGFG